MANRKKTNWIWIPDWGAKDQAGAGIVCFRKNVWLSREVKKADIEITADSRYKLYLNGVLVEFGPMKGDDQVWYLDSIDLAPYLRVGANVLAVEVLSYPVAHGMGNHGMFRSGCPGLYLKGYVQDVDGWRYDLSANESFSCRKLSDYQIEREEISFAPLMFFEQSRHDPQFQGWQLPGYREEGWVKARLREYYELPEILKKENLLKRTIPFLHREEHVFSGVSNEAGSLAGKEAWEAFIRGEGEEILIPAHTHEVIELDAGEERTGFLTLAYCGGKGAGLEILYSECYVRPEMYGTKNLPVKKDRTDAKNGQLIGYTDNRILSGCGSEDSPEIYRPFWFRCFRYLRISIQTADQPLRLRNLKYETVGYPLRVLSRVETSDPTHARIWEISERTLRLCMHETYEDCPYYEQLQYIQDARLQILYTYAVAADDRLARQCMDDFRRSQYHDGLLNCSYPNYEVNIIPGFSIHYILMVYDHMMYFGDKKLLRHHFSTIARILDYFEEHLTEEGYVEKIGGVNGEQTNWSFVDWTPEWDDCEGAPSATRYGPITMESLEYVMGLQHAAKIADYLGRKAVAEEWRERAWQVQEAVRTYCMGENGMLKDGPDVEDYSQHCQVFGILTDTLTDQVLEKRGTGFVSVGDILSETIRHRESYTQCSVAMCYYLFRALEKTGLYAYTDHYWDIWRRMLGNNCSTCTESEAYGRSECHGWGALILYELPSVVLGVRPQAPGYADMEIAPVAGYLRQAEGKVHTPRGDVYVQWKKDEKSGEILLSHREEWNHKQAARVHCHGCKVTEGEI